MVNRVIDSLIVFRILKMLTTPFNKTPAYKFGFIDAKGNRIKTLPDPNNKNVKLENNPKTKEEKNSLTPLHRLVFNLKKLIEKLPAGKSAFASYAVALLLLKEQTNITPDQMDELFEKFYSHLKENDKVTPEALDECIQVGKLYQDRPYNLRRQCKQNFDDNGEIKIYPEKTEVTDVREHGIGYGIMIYEGYIGNDRILFTAEDVY